MCAAIRSGPAVLARTLRRPAAVAIGVAALTLTVLAVRYAGDSDAGRLDRRTGSLIDTVTPDYSRPGALAVSLGDPLPVIVIAVLLAVTCLALGRRRLAIVAIAGPGLTGVATTLLKPVIGRTFEGGGLAYPSGHTAAATALGLVVAMLLVSLWRPTRLGGTVLLAAGAVVAGGGMAVALVAGDIHYPTDTIGGFSTAVVVVLGAALLVDRIADRSPAPR